MWFGIFWGGIFTQCATSLSGVVISVLGLSCARSPSDRIKNFINDFNGLVGESIPSDHFIFPLMVERTSMSSPLSDDIHFSTNTAMAIAASMIDHVAQLSNLN